MWDNVLVPDFVVLHTHTLADAFVRIARTCMVEKNNMKNIAICWQKKRWQCLQDRSSRNLFPSIGSNEKQLCPRTHVPSVIETEMDFVRWHSTDIWRHFAFGCHGTEMHRRQSVQSPSLWAVDICGRWEGVSCSGSSSACSVRRGSFQILLKTPSEKNQMPGILSVTTNAAAKREQVLFPGNMQFGFLFSVNQVVAVSTQTWRRESLKPVQEFLISFSEQFRLSFFLWQEDIFSPCVMKIRPSPKCAKALSGKCAHLRQTWVSVTDDTHKTRHGSSVLGLCSSFCIWRAGGVPQKISRCTKFNRTLLPRTASRGGALAQTRYCRLHTRL